MNHDKSQKLKTDNRLVAYIHYDDGEPYIDVIQVSKKGSSFLYAGSWWSRGRMSGCCTNEKGEKLIIRPLSRVYDPYEDYEGDIEIKSAAKGRYERWRAGKVKT